MKIATNATIKTKGQPEAKKPEPEKKPEKKAKTIAKKLSKKLSRKKSSEDGDGES